MRKQTRLQAASVEAVLISDEQPIHAFPQRPVLRLIQHWVSLKKRERFLLRPLQHLRVCTEIGNMHLRQSMLS